MDRLQPIGMKATEGGPLDIDISLQPKSNDQPHPYEERPREACVIEESLKKASSLNKKIGAPDENFKCDLCAASYSHKRNLSTHKKKIHAQKLEKKFKCANCNSQFNNQVSLNRHIKRKHNAYILKEKLFLCEECGKKFSQLKNLREHSRKFHQKGVATTVKLECPLKHECDFFPTDKPGLWQHFKETHGIELSLNIHNFEDKTAFQEWKAQMEKSSRCFYVSHGKKDYQISTKDKVTYAYYKCHRSGHYTPRGKGVRELKAQGSKKIGGHCPAEIKLINYADGSCTVKHQEVHVGHANELRHLFLTKEERQSIAQQLAMKKPPDEILKEIRNSLKDGVLERIHLSTKNDIFNIEKAFNINNDGIYHQDDAMSVHAWAEANKNNDFILYYKPQGIQEGSLTEEDFLLIIMTDTQKQMLMQFGKEVIATDGTHGIGNDEFQLVTILILDDLNQGFPAAFFITNHVTIQNLSLFFGKIKEKTGVIQTKVFMSDMDDSFYESWAQEMSEAEYRLYCNWHVDRAWRFNITKKINETEKQAEAYKVVRLLMEELDVINFEKILPQAINYLKKNYPAFGNYFEKTYGNKCKNWACCYRIGVGLNSNMHIESFHKTLKYIYFKGKKLKRLDKAVNALMQLVKDRHFEHLTAKEKGKISTKLSIIRKRHKAAKLLNIESVIQTGDIYLVPSSQKDEHHEVRLNTLQEICKCKLICRHCQLCLKQVKCDCFDNSILGNMCKHIHIAAMFRSKRFVQNVSFEKSLLGAKTKLSLETNQSKILKRKTTNTTNNKNIVPQRAYYERTKKKTRTKSKALKKPCKKAKLEAVMSICSQSGQFKYSC